MTSASNESNDMRHEGAWNSFQFDPPVYHEDVLKIADLAEKLGYRFLFRDVGYTLEEVKTQLAEQGPSAFLSIVRLQEDISPKAPPQTAEEFIAKRIAMLAPQNELLIIDPYFFTYARRNDAQEYAASVARIVAPLLTEHVRLRVVVDPNATHEGVRVAVDAELRVSAPELEIEVVETPDFHDRFWIADRERGLIVGTSLNKIGSKVFLIDKLSDSDVTAVLNELG